MINEVAGNKSLHGADEQAARRAVRPVEVTSLQIDYDHDQNFDPYNRTGQFVVVGRKSGN